MSERPTGESEVLEALRGWGEEPIDPPNADESAALRRHVVGRMAERMRIEHTSRRVARRRWTFALVAAAVLVLLAGTALALSASRSKSALTPAHDSAGDASRAIATFGNARGATPSPGTPPTAAPDPVAPSAPASASPSVSSSAKIGPLAHSAPSAKPAEPASQLAEQNRIFSAAMAARRNGDDASAVRLCDELLARFPDSPLASQARAERASAAARLAQKK